MLAFLGLSFAVALTFQPLGEGKAPWVQVKEPLATFGTRPITATVTSLAKGSTGEADEITLSRGKGKPPVQLTVLVPPSAPLPLIIGETVKVTFGARPGRLGQPETSVGTVVIQDARGGVLLAIGDDRKGKWSMVAYVAAIPLTFVHPLAAAGLYVAVALTWLVPDTRIEKRLAQKE